MTESPERALLRRILNPRATDGAGYVAVGEGRLCLDHTLELSEAEAELVREIGWSYE